MDHVFVDANILVGFFEHGPEQLVILDQLRAAIVAQKVSLWMPMQAQREYRKNRDKSISTLLDQFEKQRSYESAPLLVRIHPQFSAAARLHDELRQLQSAIAQDVRARFEGETTAADVAISKLLAHATVIDTDDSEIYRRADVRARCHMPPGTKEEIGDRLNWEALLDAVPKSASLHVVTEDRDYRSGSSSRISGYLENEWREKNQGTIRLWQRVSEYLAETFPDGATAVDMEREIAVQALRTSGSFRSTHSAITTLSQLHAFTAGQARDLVESLLQNDQVSRISTDSDVFAFFKKLRSEQGASIPVDLASQLDEVLQQAQQLQDEHSQLL